MSEPATTSSPNSAVTKPDSQKAVPKLPPKTYKDRRKSSIKIRPPPKIVDETEYPSEQLVSEKVLPQMVVVSSGYDGATPENCVSVGEEFVIHLVKCSQVLPAKLVGGSEEIHIPIDSMLSIGIVRKNEKKIYSSVKDLLKLSQLPMVVQVNSAFTCKLNDNYRVENGSILYIAGRNGKSNLFCQHESSGEHLTLPSDVVGKFSTDPDNAFIAIAHYTTLFKVYPVTVVLLQKGVDVDDQFLEQYIGQTFVLEKPIEKRSLIATTDVSGTRIDNPALVEIPMNIPLSFKCIERSEVDMERAYTTAVELYSKFDPSKIDVQYGTRVVSESKYAQIYQSVDGSEDEEYYVSFDIVCPNPRTEALKRALQKHRSKGQVRQKVAKSITEKFSAQKNKKQPAQLKKVDKRSSFTSSKQSLDRDSMTADEDLVRQLTAERDLVKQLSEREQKLITDNAQLNSKVDTLKLQLHYSEQNCADLEAELTRVKKNVSKLTNQLEQLNQRQTQMAAAATASAEDNRKRLRRMRTVDIIGLLKHMDYQMYEKSFTAEHIDGMLLSTLEEADLRELGIQNSIHRRRFINIIQGKESVNKYLLN